MNPGSTKEWKNAYPRTLLSIVAAVGGLAMFLLLASTVLVSQPIGSTVRRYFYGVDSLKKIDPESSLRPPVPNPSHIVDPSVDTGKYNLTFPSGHGNEVISQQGNVSAESGGDDSNRTVSEKNQSSQSQGKDEKTPDSGQVESENSKDKFPPLKEINEKDSTESGGDDGKGTGSEKNESSQSQDKDETPDSGQVESENSKDKLPPSKETQEKDSAEPGGDDGKGTVSEKSRSYQSQEKDESLDSGKMESENSKDKFPPSKETQDKDSDGSLFSGDTGNASVSNNGPEFGGDAAVSSNNVPAEPAESVDSSAATSNSSQANAIDSDCDLYHGKWVLDSTGPLYSNNTCPVITQMQNCQGNGRPDKEYENWRWKPSQCDLPRLDPKKFLELMRGKTLAFIGDSVARNQMESMLCILWQAEVPKNRGNKKMQRYYFRSTNTMIVRIWSSWLVHQTDDPFDYAPAAVTKLHLDAPDEGFMQYITDFDVIVLSSGHWFAKKSVYILNNEIVGGQLWWPDNKRQKKIDNIQAFGVSVETILTAMGTHPNYTGLTIVRSFSPDHYEGGAWNTGGSCTGKVKPALDGELVENGFTNIMHEKQVMGFDRAIKKKTNKSKMKLMDITEIFSYRHDGHPGPYRSPDPNKITKRGPDGRPPSQDCLHWCMPGPVDTWNELVFEIIRRESHDRESNSS